MTELMYDKLDFLYMAGVCASLFLAAAAYSGRRIGGCTAAMRWFCAAAVSAAATQSFLLIAPVFYGHTLIQAAFWLQWAAGMLCLFVAGRLAGGSVRLWLFSISGTGMVSLAVDCWFRGGVNPLFVLGRDAVFIFCSVFLAGTRPQTGELFGSLARGSARRYASIFAAGLCLMAGGWFITEYFGKSAVSAYRKDMLARVKTAASAVNPQRVARLSGQTGDVRNPDYRRLLQQLGMIHRVNNDCEYVYLLGVRRTGVFYFAGSSRSEDAPGVLPGTPYSRPVKLAGEIFGSGIGGIEGPVTDGNGQWISFMAPVKHIGSEKVLAVLGFDLAGWQYQRWIRSRRLAGLAVMGIAVYFFIFSWLIRREHEADIMSVKFSEALYRAVVEGQHELIAHFTQDWRIVFVNEAFCKFMGGSKESWAGKDFAADILPEKERGRFLDFIVSLRHDPVSTVFEYWFERAGQETRFLRWHVRFLDREGGGPVQIQAVGRDITERRRAEDAVRKLSRAVEQSPSTVVITSLDGSIEYVNPKFSETTGYSREEVLGKNPRILKSGDKPAEMYKDLWRTIISGREWRGEFLNKRKNGEDYWEFASVSGIRDDKGVITHFLKVSEDISEQKRMSRLKDEFVNTVSHELRTPLTAIKEGLAIVYDGSAGPLTEEQKDFLETATRNVDRLARLINDVLDFQKLQAGAMKFNKQPIDPNGVISEVFQTMAPLAAARQLQLIAAPGEDIPHVLADRDKIIQVLVNLVNNAFKFTESGTITISSELRADNGVKISVSDTGIGIRPEDQRKLFVSFSQVGSDMYKKSPGSTGLGLAISKEIVYYHGGKIGVDSDFGRGSTFYFILPVVERRSHLRTG